MMLEFDFTNVTKDIKKRITAETAKTIEDKFKGKNINEAAIAFTESINASTAITAQILEEYHKQLMNYLSDRIK